MLNFMKEFFKNYLYFALGGLFPFIIYFFVLLVFFDENPFITISVYRFPKYIILLVALPIAVPFFVAYYTWLKYRLTENFHQIKWYFHTISGFCIISLFAFIFYAFIKYKIAGDFIESIQNSKCSSLCYFFIICFFSLPLAEINYQFKKRNYLQSNNLKAEIVEL